MRVFVTVNSGITVHFDESEFDGLTSKEKEARIHAAVKEIVADGVTWYEIYEKVVK